MADFSFSTSISMMRRTASFVVFRVIDYFAIPAVYMIVTGVKARVGWGVGVIDADRILYHHPFVASL